MKICVVTGSRAEYGLLRPIIEEINNREGVQLQIIATGMHLLHEFGQTFREIESDGYSIDKKVEMMVSGDTGSSVSKSIGLGVISFSDAFFDLKPDLVLLLGDRYEIFSASISALNALIPVGHIHGGETGAGTIDNMIRHAITKMSTLHFVSTEVYQKRVIQLGEHPSNVYSVGAPGVENIMKLNLLSKSELERDLDFVITENTILFTYHPVPLKENLALEELNNILKVFDAISDLKIIITKANADAGGRQLNMRLEEYGRLNKDKCKVVSSLGSLRYLSALKHVKVVVGNSSSGIIEAPSLGTYTLDIGSRQKGRARGETVINCQATYEDVYSKLSQVLKKEKKERFNNPYEKEGTSKEIVNICIQRLSEGIELEKDFYDLEV